MTMYLDQAILETLQAQTARHRSNYQALVNETLQQMTLPDSISLTIDSLRRMLREEFGRHDAKPHGQ
ncbi:hypothetical protein [Collimonas sp. OK607]|uniref:hypothetical protein n=1 Tax=Collimonas sp. OK607 TaxID=1798194 RepID=UPI001113FFB9|nr:hypothetical protein [Collimonas sp. OK607]